MSETNGKDGRVDRAAGFLLQTFIGVAITVTGAYAKATADKVDALTATQAGLGTEVAVLRRALEDTVETRRIVAALQLHVIQLQSEVTTLRRDVDRPPR